MKQAVSLKKAKRIVIKVGTSTITYANGKRNFSQIDRLAQRNQRFAESGQGNDSGYQRCRGCGRGPHGACPENPKLFPASRPLLP